MTILVSIPDVDVVVVGAGVLEVSSSMMVDIILLIVLVTVISKKQHNNIVMCRYVQY